MTMPPPHGGPQQHPAPDGWGARRSFAAPHQFQPVPDGMLQSQRSTRVATRALVWSIVACVVAATPLLGLFTLAAAIPALQIAISARMQRLGGGGRAIWAIVLSILAILGSIGWSIVWFVVGVGLLVPGTAGAA